MRDTEGITSNKLGAKIMALSDLARYQLTSEEQKRFAEFKLVVSNVNLEAVNPVNLNIPALTELENKPGVYFWMMRLENCTYKVYAGKTRSLPRRLRDYRNRFQEHVPNDYKLRFFQTFIFGYHKDAEFDLYFIAADSHTQKENEVLRNYRPLIINEPANVSEKDRKAMKDAFENYYTSIFKEKLG